MDETASHLDEFRAAVAEAVGGSAKDVMSGGYGFEYDRPRAYAFEDLAVFRQWVLDGGPGDDLQEWHWWEDEEMEAIVEAAIEAEFDKLDELWPCKLSKETWESLCRAVSLIDRSSGVSLVELKSAKEVLDKAVSELEE